VADALLVVPVPTKVVVVATQGFTQIAESVIAEVAAGE
jgi:hypothetical protein